MACPPKITREKFGVQLFLRGMVAQARLAPHRRVRAFDSTTGAHRDGAALPFEVYFRTYNCTQVIVPSDSTGSSALSDFLAVEIDNLLTRFSIHRSSDM